MFGRYYLKRTLGENGMGVVWLAHDRLLEQPIALKCIAPHLVLDRGEIERLKTETRRSRLSNIVRTHDFIQTPQGVAVAMEYVDGWSLWSLKVDKPGQYFGFAGDRAVDTRSLCGTAIRAFGCGAGSSRYQTLNLIINSRGQLKISGFRIIAGTPARPGASRHGRARRRLDWYMSPQQWTE